MAQEKLRPFKLYKNNPAIFVGLFMLVLFLYFSRFEIVKLIYPYVTEKENVDLIYNPGEWACAHSIKMIQTKSPEISNLIHSEVLKTFKLSDEQLKARISEQKSSRELARFLMDFYAKSEADQLRSVRNCVREILLATPDRGAESFTALVAQYPLAAKSPSPENTDWGPFLNKLCEKNEKCVPAIQERILAEVGPAEYGFYYDLLKAAHGAGLKPVLEVYSKLKNAKFDETKNAIGVNAQIVAMKSVIKTAFALRESQVAEELLTFVNDEHIAMPVRFHLYLEIPDVDKSKAAQFKRELAINPNVTAKIQQRSLEKLAQGDELALVTYADFNQIQSQLISGFQTERYNLKVEFRSAMERLLTESFEKPSTAEIKNERKKAADLFVPLFILTNNKFGPNSNEIQQLLIVGNRLRDILNFEKMAKPLFNRKDSFVLAYQLIYQTDVQPEVIKQMLTMFRNFSADEKKTFLLTCVANRTHGKYFVDLIPELDISVLIDIKNYWDGHPARALEDLKRIALKVTGSSNESLKLRTAAYFMTNDSAIGKKLTAAAMESLVCQFTNKVLNYRLWAIGLLPLKVPQLKELLDCLTLADIERLRYPVMKSDDIKKLKDLSLSKQASPDLLLKIQKILSLSTP